MTSLTEKRVCCIEDKFINELPRKSVYPTVMNNIIDITELTESVLIEHILDQVEPTNLILISRNNRSDITVYLRPSYKIDTKYTKVTKKYNSYPFIINTTSTKVVLLNYHIDFIVDREEGGKTDQSDVIRVSTPVLCNDLHAVYNSTFTINGETMTGCKNVDRKLLPIQTLIRSSSCINVSYEEICRSQKEYIPNIHSSNIKKFRRTSLIRDGVPDLFEDYTNELNIVALNDLLRYRGLIKYDNLKKMGLYRILSFNGLFIGYCSDGVYQSKFSVNCNVVFESRFFNGVVCGCSSTLSSLDVNVVGDLDMRNQNSFFSGIVSGSARWIDNVNVNVDGDVYVSGNVIGLVSGTTTGVYNMIKCTIRDRLQISDVNTFGTVIGYLAPKPTIVSDDDSDQNCQKQVKTDNFSFKLVLCINGNFRTNVLSDKDKKYDVVGDVNDLCTAQNTIFTPSTKHVQETFSNTDKIQKDGEVYSLVDDDVEGILDDTLGSKLNLNRRDDRGRSDKKDTDQTTIRLNLPDVKTVNKTKHVNQTDTQLQHSQKSLQHPPHLMNVLGIDENSTFKRHDPSWSMFNTIRDLRQHTGSSLSEFPKNIDIEKKIKRRKKKMNTKNEIISQIMNKQDDHGDLNNFDETSSSLYEQNIVRLVNDATSMSGSLLYNPVKDNEQNDDLLMRVKINYLTDTNDDYRKSTKKREVNGRCKSDKTQKIIDTSEIFDEKYRINTNN